MRLYRLMKEDHILDTILNHRIKISTIDNLNDPYEMMPVCLDNDENPLPDCYVREKMRYVVRNTGLLCMTKVIDSPMIWAHYGNSHKGVALEFECDDTIQDMFSVNYTDKRKQLSVEDFPDTKSEYNKMFLELSTAKAKCWEHEQEIRLLYDLRRENVLMNAEGLFYINLPEELKRIILGVDCKISKVVIQKALDICELIDIKVVRAKFSESKYEIVVDD